MGEQMAETVGGEPCPMGGSSTTPCDKCQPLGSAIWVPPGMGLRPDWPDDRPRPWRDRVNLPPLHTGYRARTFGGPVPAPPRGEAGASDCRLSPSEDPTPPAQTATEETR